MKAPINPSKMSFFTGDSPIFSTKICKNCAEQFNIQAEDQKFYQEMKVPEPTLCPLCRLKRKMIHINQINLFKRTCDATGKSIIANYPPNTPFPVYSQEYWYSDQNDTLKYGRDFDFNRPFFEQFQELANVVPRPPLFTDYLKDENSDYTNFAGKNKNCYLIFDSDENWDCLYSYGINSCKNSLDLYRCQEMELCAESLDSKGCYNSAYLSNCEKCIDSWFLDNCIGCQNCLMCVNLHHKEYYVRNQPVSRAEFEKIRSTLTSTKTINHLKEEFQQFPLKFPRRFRHGLHNEGVSGNYLVHCKNTFNSFDCMNTWDGKYCTQIFIKAKDCMDVHECGDCELIYDSAVVGYNAYNCRWSLVSLSQINNLTYCRFCFFSSNLFGCFGLKRQKYCILNKQYTPEEYFKIVERIIEHMKKTNQWGEFFPESISDFPYNLTVAHDNFPLKKAEALAKGFRWQDEDPKSIIPQKYSIPDSVSDAKEDITNEILVCEECGRNFKIIPQELDLHRKINLPLPSKCFHCCHRNRKSKRNPRRLFSRKCQKCAADIQTTYAPDRPQIIYCERCFQENLN